MRENKDLEKVLKREELDEMNQWIQEAKSVALAAHLHPDGDAYGSVLGLGQVLRDMGKDVDMIAFERISHLSYMKGLDLLSEIQEGKDYDLFILLDLGDFTRLGDAKKAYDRSRHSICFDHHLSNREVCDHNLIMTDASSTCEIVTLFLEDYDYVLSPEAATALYNGLITDSNRFLYDTARARALRTAADLIDLGAEVHRIYFYEYNCQDPRILAFQGHAIESAEFLQEGQIVLFPLRKKEAAHYGLTVDDVENTVDILRSLQGVEIAVQVREEEAKKAKLSFRSKNYYNVGELADSLGGGGHIHASGATLEKSVDQAMDQLRPLLEGLDLEKAKQKGSVHD